MPVYPTVATHHLVQVLLCFEVPPPRLSLLLARDAIKVPLDRPDQRSTLDSNLPTLWNHVPAKIVHDDTQSRGNIAREVVAQVAEHRFKLSL